MTRFNVQLAALLLIGCFVYHQLYAGQKPENASASFVKCDTNELDELVANHQQGSIGFTIDGTDFLYYVAGETTFERTLAVSAVIGDIRASNKMTLKHEAYGLHRRVVNLQLLFKTLSDES